MPKLDTRKLLLTDGTELAVRFSWQAAFRFRQATGIDIADTQAEQKDKITRINQNLGALIHSILATKEDRSKWTPEEIGERIAFEELPRMIEEIFAMIDSGTEGQKNVPFVNGVAGGDDSTLKLPTPSGASISG